MFLFVALSACAGSTDAESAEAETPTVAFVSPHDGDTVPAGEIAVSIAIGHFLLADPSKHTEGEAEGYLQVDWTDGTGSDSVQTGETTPTLSIATPGSWTLTADLIFADGDGMDEAFPDFAPASITITVE